MTVKECKSGLRFGDFDPELTDLASARAVVVPLPYDATTTWLSGSRAGPQAILEASQALEWFDEQLMVEPCRAGIATLDPLEPDARGPEHQLTAVRDHLAGIVAQGKFFVALGGEHSLTLGCVQAWEAASDEPFSVLQIDAHADLRDSYQGSVYSHACVMRRIHEGHGMVGVGIRSFSAEEHAYMQAEKIHAWTMDRIRSTPDWIEGVLDGLARRVYLTIDLDGLDPSICPGVGTPEPGGLLWHQLTDLLRSLFSAHEVISADVVECLPLPGQHVSQYLAARLVYKLIGYRFQKHCGA